MNDKVSIIMPCYKAEKYIADTLNDILNQTYTNWELIAVSNGAGQEPQLKILKEFQQKDSLNRIRIITEEKGNVSNARNIGMKEATGTWTTFADDDDRIDPNHLQLFMDKAKEGEADIIIGGFETRRIKENSTIVNEINSKNKYIAKMELLNLQSMVLGTVWTKIFKTSFLRNNELYFEDAWHQRQDVVFVLRSLLKTDKVLWISMCGYKWICRDEQSGMTRYNVNYESEIKIYRDLECENMRQCGCNDAEISKHLRDVKYLDGYFFVCNLFKKGSPLHFGEKRSAIKRYVFDDEEMRSAIASEDRTKHNLFLKIYDFALAFHSPTMMTIIFQAQYTLKYNFMPLYLKIAPRLRK